MKDIHMGEAVRAARLARDLTQEELAEKCGVRQSNVSAWERRKGLRLSTIEQVAKALRMSSEQVLRGGVS